MQGDLRNRATLIVFSLDGRIWVKFMVSEEVEMAVSEDILTARRFGVVHCGVSSLPAPSITDLAREFGLRSDAECYREIDEASARLSVRRLLHRDLAYSVEVMPEQQAEQLTEQFLAQFG